MVSCAGGATAARSNHSSEPDSGILRACGRYHLSGAKSPTGVHRGVVKKALVFELWEAGKEP